MKDTIRTRCSNYFATMLFVLVDYVVIVVAEKVAFVVYGVFSGTSNGGHILSPSFMFGLIPIVFMSFLQTHNVYGRMRPTVDTVRDIFTSITSGCFVLIVMMYFLGGRFSLSWPYMLILGSFLLAVTYVLRYAVYKLLKKYNLLAEPIIIVGAQKTAEAVIDNIGNDLMYRYKLVGIIDDCPENLTVENRCLLMGATDQAEQIIKDSGVQTVLITAPGMEKNKLGDLIARIQPYVRNISYVPDLIGIPMRNVTATTFFDKQILMLQLKNNLARRRNRIIKRFFDLLLTISGGIFIIPIILILTVLIRWDSKGPAFYNAERIGKHEKTFKCYKFRSMYQNSDAILKKYLAKHSEAQKEWDTYAKLRDYDPRVTRLGAFMRKTSLDELPQLWNVIKGDMSLVGPRPYLPREKADIGSAIGTICLTTPGITGYWQVSGRNNISFAGRVNMDTWYVQNWSVWVDMVYLIKTFKVVFCGRGAY